MALINLRNALMAGKRLPYDAEVEYLESTGTEYIITDYVPNDSSVAELDFQSVGNSPSLMGVYSASSRFNLGISTANKNWFGGIGAGNTKPTTALADSSWRKLILDAPQKTLTVSGVGSYPCGSGSVGGNTAKFNLFARHSNGDGKNLHPARLYGVKFSEGGVLVRDFIPVRKGTVGYLYDRVSGKLFGNAGTGDFVLGQDVVPVEWLGFDGSQYIDTGLTVKSTLRIACDVRIDDVCRVFGGRTASGSNQFDLFQYSITDIRPSYGNRSVNVTGVGTGRHTFDFNQNAFSVDGVVKQTFKAQTFSAPSPIYIGALSTNDSGAASSSKLIGRLYSTDIYDGDPARKFRAVRVGTEGAMMDVLTRRVYRNAGTGAFTYGNDLKYPIPA